MKIIYGSLQIECFEVQPLIREPKDFELGYWNVDIEVNESKWAIPLIADTVPRRLIFPFRQGTACGHAFLTGIDPTEPNRWKIHFRGTGPCEVLW